MATSGIAGVDSDYLKNTTETKAKSALDKDAFMNLLVTQMKYQDPLNPMDNQQMMAQLAQFSALEQMSNVAQSAEKQLANSMLGKYVAYTYKDTSTGKTEDLMGKVDYVKLSNGNTLLGIGDKEIKLEDVLQVIGAENVQDDTTAFELIGKVVQGKIKQADSTGIEETVVIEGEVLALQMKNGKPYLTIGTGTNKVEVNFEDVENIVEKPSVTGKMVTATVKATDGTEKVVAGLAEYIAIKKAGTYVYVNGQFVKFEDIETVKNK